MNQTIFLPVSGIKPIFKNPSENAEITNLIYVNDLQDGITRIKKNEKFIYFFKGKKVTDRKELDRIRKLVIPPAWEQVWICRLCNGHLQATGIDAKGRKQYKYHTQWNALRDQTKFQKLVSFGEKLPQLRSRIEKDLAQKELSIEKVLALIISLMERTYIRIGNSGYEKLYGSHGLTTLKDEHVKIEGDRIRFSFQGKKGVHHKISLTNRRLARLVKQCREIPGRELFQYYDENNEAHAVHSEHVNNYIRLITEEDFTAKDFRTWAGSIHAIYSLLDLGEAETITACKQNINKTLEYVSEKLGNTRAVCKKYYIHPVIIDMYENKELHQFVKKYDNKIKARGSQYSPEEILLLEILKRK